MKKVYVIRDLSTGLYFQCFSQIEGKSAPIYASSFRNADKCDFETAANLTAELILGVDKNSALAIIPVFIAG